MGLDAIFCSLCVPLRLNFLLRAGVLGLLADEREGFAQAIGEILPLTHFIRIARGILLKGNGLWDIAPEIWPIALFAAVALTIGVKRYRQTLD